MALATAAGSVRRLDAPDGSAGSLARAHAPRAGPASSPRPAERLCGPAVDGLALGLAQALALAPGVSRNGATLTAARARGFARAGGGTRSSWRAALPVLLGASALQGIAAARMRQERRGARASASGSLARRRAAAGGVSAFGSTLLSARAGARLRLGQRAAARRTRSIAACWRARGVLAGASAGAARRTMTHARWER